MVVHGRNVLELKYVQLLPKNIVRIREFKSLTPVFNDASIQRSWKYCSSWYLWCKFAYTNSIKFVRPLLSLLIMNSSEICIQSDYLLPKNGYPRIEPLSTFRVHSAKLLNESVWFHLNSTKWMYMFLFNSTKWNKWMCFCFYFYFHLIWFCLFLMHFCIRSLSLWGAKAFDFSNKLHLVYQNSIFKY